MSEVFEMRKPRIEPFEIFLKSSRERFSHGNVVRPEADPKFVNI